MLKIIAKDGDEYTHIEMDGSGERIIIQTVEAVRGCFLCMQEKNETDAALFRFVMESMIRSGDLFRPMDGEGKEALVDGMTEDEKRFFQSIGLDVPEEDGDE